MSVKMFACDTWELGAGSHKVLGGRIYFKRDFKTSTIKKKVFIPRLKNGGGEGKIPGKKYIYFPLHTGQSANAVFVAVLKYPKVLHSTMF